MDRTKSSSAIEKARLFVREGDRKNAITEYCEVFLTRLDPLLSDIDFILFYRRQMENYFNIKKNLFISLPEGDMVTDLIRMTYDDFMQDWSESPFKKSKKGRERLLSSIKIIFPVQNDTLLDDERVAVSK